MVRLSQYHASVPGLVCAILFVTGCSAVLGSSSFDFDGEDAEVGRDGGSDAGPTDSGSPDAGPCMSADDCTLAPGAAIMACVDAACVVDTCAVGLGDCDGLVANGCEADLQTDLEHCGACANTCQFANAVAACVSAACEIERCLGGFGNCDGSRLTGCEADLRSPATCGSCANTCEAPTILCDSAADPVACVEMCSAGATLCETRCVNLASDPTNCGACDFTCTAPANAEATCEAMDCGFACVSTFRDCDGDATNGCERNTATNIDHCGACDNACQGGNASWTCTSSACQITMCEPGFDDCDESPTNGCEVDLRTDVSHCGGCGQVCDGPCVDGVCDPIVDFAGGDYGGSAHRCAVRTSGRLFCWGENATGQLGDGTTGVKAVPTAVLSPAGSTEELLLAQAVSGGQASTCAIDTDGLLWCWGRGANGERGGGSVGVAQIVLRPEPVVSTDAAFDARTFTALGAGQSHHCAVDDQRDLWCWGRNNEGQVTGTTTTVFTATRVVGASQVEELAVAGRTTCVRTASERVFCWGANESGQVGDGTTINRSSPVEVRRSATEDFTGVIQLAAGAGHFCALTGAGAVYCWGLNSSRELGVATGMDANPWPVLVEPGVAVASIHAGAAFSCVRTPAGATWCWGRRTEGQRGDGLRVPNDHMPTELVGIAGSIRIFIRGQSGYAAFADGTVRSWGSNSDGQLAQEPIALRGPTPIASTTGSGTLGPIASLAAGHRHGCAIVDGDTLCWGENTYNGFVDGGQMSAVPRRVESIASGATLAVAGYFSSGVVVGGVARGWGHNTSGQIGVGDMGSALPSGAGNPRQVAVASPVSTLVYGASHGCALREGELWCWGVNTSGELGQGTMSANEVTPARVSDWTDVIDVALGEGFTCALREGRSLWCWGAGGRLGVAGGSMSSPVELTVFSRPMAVALGRFHACAIEEAAEGAGQGQVFCWGSASFGAVLGDGTTNASAVPVLVTGVDDAIDVAVGSTHACAVRASGQVWCWGRNENGEVGDGTAEARLVAVPVPGLTDVVRLTAGNLRGTFTCALRTDQTGACWGDCRQGACGTGEALYRPTPALAESL